MPAPLPNSALDSLGSYPSWFVAACLTLVVAAALWILAKLLKWSLELLVWLVLIGGAVMTVWLMLH